ncbi:uncharacterized protein LOC129406992 isoform X3 [Sorex araneus]|uniref:uncharacterized protein LOC129406992 isoform X3 n=1 Tax=Sorex araneus TaxID=42254 RepID=UPI002433C622|nr:uncharacterized protein LOC129406992 isoform X3 [Sorex araneus]
MILLLLLVLTRRGGCACVCVHGRLSFPSTSARIHKTPPLQRELQTCASVRRSVRPCACPPSPTLLPPETQSAIPAPLSAFQRSVRPAQTTHQRHSGLTLGSPLRDHSWNAQGTLWVLDIEPGSASCKARPSSGPVTHQTVQGASAGSSSSELARILADIQISSLGSEKQSWREAETAESLERESESLAF